MECLYHVADLLPQKLKETPKRLLLLGLLPILLSLYKLRTAPRPKKISPTQERVVILGASSGIGRTLARLYAWRGAKRVCVVGRRGEMVDVVVEECRGEAQAAGSAAAAGSKGSIVGFVGDFTSVDDMVRLREMIKSEWGGIDTLVIAAGVSALQPIMTIAGVQRAEDKSLTDATPEGIKQAVDISQTAAQGNFIGPLVAAVTFIPLLTRTSPSPSILLVSSLAALIPAPTRALYASTKSAGHVLFQGLALEHPEISFTLAVPSTVEGAFRSSAVDKHLGPVRESDPNAKGSKALKTDEVASRCVRAVDWQEEIVWQPKSMKFAHGIYWWVWPRMVEAAARKKYNFKI